MSKGLEYIEAKIKLGEYYFLSESNLKQIEKELQALEIIKNKRVDVEWLLDKSCKSVEDFNFIFEEKYYWLTQEEYALLKEVLCDE